MSGMVKDGSGTVSAGRQGRVSNQQKREGGNLNFEVHPFPKQNKWYRRTGPWISFFSPRVLTVSHLQTTHLFTHQV